MLGINFEKNTRPKNKERDFIAKEVATFEDAGFRDDVQEDTLEPDELSEDSADNLDVLDASRVNDESSELDVKEEIRAIRAMKPGREKDKALSELKEKYLWQQQGLGVLKDELFEELSSSDDINKSKIDSIIIRYSKKYKFSSLQLMIIQRMVEMFIRKNRAVNNFCEDSSRDGNKLYRRFYNIEPNGKVELHQGPISLALICSDKDDYARMYENDSSGKQDFERKSGKDADKSAGFFSWSYPQNFTELRGTIIGVKKLEDYHNIDEIIVHEEQHALNKIYSFYIRPAEKEGLSSFFYACHNIESMRDMVSSFCRYLLEDASNRAKDEILAYKSEAGGGRDIVNSLTKTKEDGGLYDYFEYSEKMKLIGDACEGNILEEYKDELLDLAESILKHKYKKLIEAGLTAVDILQNKNYSQTALTAVLMPQSLDNWLKTAERAQYYNGSLRQQNQFQNNISRAELDGLEKLKGKLSKKAVNN